MVNNIKKNAYGKSMDRIKLAGGLALALGAGIFLPGRANADLLKVQFTNNPSISPNTLSIRHISSATEGYDSGKDFDLPPQSGPSATVYSSTDFQVPFDRLGTDARPWDSLTTICGKIDGSNLSGVASIAMRFSASTLDFTNKNIQGGLYQITNGVRGDLLGVYDIKQMVATNGIIPLTLTNGHCYDLDVKFTSKLNNPNIESIVANQNSTADLGVANVSGGSSLISQMSTNLVDWTPVATNYIPVTPENFGSVTNATVNVPMYFPNSEGSSSNCPLPSAFYRIKVD